MTRTYTPRRAGLKRWLEGAPDYILDCFDDPRSADRYTVFLTGPEHLSERREGDTSCGSTIVPYLGMSSLPAHPQGVSMWGELNAHETAQYRNASGRFRVAWASLPEHIRAHVVARTTQE